MDTIQPEEIRAHMNFLADDLLEGRDAGTRGYDIAANYVRTQFEAMGLMPAGDDGTYYQQVPLRRAALDESESFLRIRFDGGSKSLKIGDDYLLRPNLGRSDVPVEAVLVFAGYGIRAPELDHDDYEGLDASGKIVVHLSGAPESFGSTERAVYSSRETKAAQALDAGAVGLLTVLTELDLERRPWERFREGSRSPSMAWIDPDTSQTSSALDALDVVGVMRASESLLASDASDVEPGATAEARTVSHHEALESPNVVAMLEGDPGEEVVVYSSHLDHVGRGTPEDGDDIYNGAYDNASGIAVILAVARAFASTETRPARSIVFIAVTAEEKGLLGSDFFAQHPSVSAPVVANVNVDGALMFHPLRDIIAFGADHSTLLDPVSRAASQLGIELSPDFMPEEVIFVRSDQYSFVRQGIPAVYPFVGTDTGSERVDGERVLRDWMATRYHKPSDDMSQEMDFDAGADYAKLCYLIGELIANDAARPQWNEGDFLGAKFAR